MLPGRCFCLPAFPVVIRIIAAPAGAGSGAGLLNGLLSESPFLLVHLLSTKYAYRAAHPGAILADEGLNAMVLSVYRGRIKIPARIAPDGIYYSNKLIIPLIIIVIPVHTTCQMSCAQPHNISNIGSIISPSC